MSYFQQAGSGTHSLAALGTNSSSSFKTSTCMLSYFSRIRIFVTPRTVSRQAPLSMGFSRQGYWSGSPCPPPGDLPDPGIEHASPVSSALAGGFFTTNATWEAPSKRPPVLQMFTHPLAQASEQRGAQYRGGTELCPIQRSEETWWKMWLPQGVRAQGAHVISTLQGTAGYGAK